MEILREMPEQEVLEWFIHPKDGKGVVVRANLRTHRLEPDLGFEQRRRDWFLRHFDDPYSLSEMPSLALLEDYLAGDRGVFFDVRTHKLERPL